MEGITRIVRITNSRRLADRVLIVQIKEPDEPELEKLGKIFAIVEIESPLSENRQIAQAIINTLSRSYFNEKAKDPSEQFEKAIKHVNKELHKITKAGDSDWLGKINAILGLTVNDSIHLSSTGKVNAWVVRHQMDNAILDGDDHVHSPEKTFSHIVSGSLESKDILLFASSGLLELVSPSTLKGNVFSGEDLLTAAIRFGQILRAKRGYWINGVLLDFHSFRDAAEVVKTKIPETIYLDSGSNFDFRILTANTVKATSKSSKRVSHILKGWGNDFKTFVDKSIIPANKKAVASLKSFATSSGNSIKKGVTEAQKKAQELKEAREAQAKVAEGVKKVAEVPTPTISRAIDGVSSVSNTVSEEASLIGKNLIENSPISNPSQKKSTNIKAPKLPKINSDFIKTKLKDVNFLWKALAVLLIGLLIFSLGSTILNSEKNTQNEQLVTELDGLSNKLDEASLALTMGQKDVANTALGEVKEKTPSYLETDLKDRAQEIINRAELLEEELDGIQRLAFNDPTFEIADGTNLSTGNGFIFASSENELLVFNLSDQKETKNILANKIISSAPYNDLFLAYENTIVNLISRTLVVKKPTTSDSWEQGIAIDSFNGNAYILSPSKNQIWRYSSSGENFGAKAEYIKDSSNISNAVDFAIDGKIYVLKSDGKIISFLQGAGSELKLTGLEKTLINSKAIKTTADLKNLYILADNKIYIFSKEGKFTKAFRSPNEVADFTISDDEKSLFILTDGKVFEVKI